MSVFGVGYSESNNSFQCGIEAASHALNSAGLQKNQIQVCFLFCTSRHDPHELTEGVKNVIGESRFVGGFTNGAIDNHHTGYDGFQAVVGVFQSDTVEIEMLMEEGIAFNEYETGKRLAEKIKEKKYPEDIQMLVFFDAVNRQKGYFQMNYGTPFLKGMEEVLPTWPNVAGARFLGDMSFKPTYQWFEKDIVQNSASAIIFKGDIQMDVQVMHGCTPASSYHTVTKSDGATILELNEVPVMDFLNRFFGEELAGNYQQLKFFVTMGKNYGDKWADFNAQDYVNRMCVGIDRKKGGLKMAEVDMVQGTEVQLMRRGFEMAYVEQQTRDIINEVEARNRKPIFALYLNCAGRAAAYSENSEEDAYYVRKAIKDRFPLLGIYEAGELAKVNGKLEVLDWTGIFCLFSEKNQA
ncbi:MAG: FIST C-terminal domain-containing protein [Bacteroidia bacterium]|nr:FIST C-terminal domain-containing protein [Bacteroidia bacterium]